MTYTIVQKVKDKYYLCEVNAVWDPVKKNSKQSRKYIGRCDKDGNLLDQTALRINSKSFGSYYLMTKIAEESGVLKVLESVFGRENGRMFTAFSIIRSLRLGRPQRTSDLLLESFLPEMLGLNNPSEWSSLSAILRNISAITESKMDVMKGLAENGPKIILETSAFRRPLNLLAIEGMNMDVVYGFQGMPPASIMIGLDGERLLPYYYGTIHGEDVDVQSLASIRREVVGLSPGQVEFCLDVKNWDEAEIAEMMGSGLSISLQLSEDSTLGRRIISDSVKMFKGSSETYVNNGIVYRVYEKIYMANGHPVRAIVYLNEKRRNDELLALYSHLDVFESEVSKMEWSDDLASRIRRELGFYDLSNLVNLSEGEDGRVVVERKRKAVSAIENRYGKWVMITNTDHTWDELLDIWKKRSDIEYCIQLYKTDLEGGVLYFPSVETAFGAFLVELMCIRLQSELVSRIRRSPLARRADIWEVTSELEKLKISDLNGEWYINEISPFQKSLLETLGVPVPTDKVIREMVRGHSR